MSTAPEPSRGRADRGADSGSDSPADHHTVVVVDDHHLVRVAVHTLVGQEPDLAIIGEAGSLEEARSVLGDVKHEDCVARKATLDKHVTGTRSCRVIDGR